MGKFFSDVVEQALKDIYYDVTTGRGQESFRRLEQASAAGDGDASCILARCLCGYQYTWEGHGFPEDDDRAIALYHKSVEQGSAIGVLVALRTGELTPQDQAKMPFSSLQEAFDVVLRKAEMGDAFCQYTVGNAYFWWDFLEIQGKGRESFANPQAFKAYLRENISKCEDWFWKAFRGGMYHAGNNLCRYYEKGDEDIIAPQPEKAQGIWRMGAELGYPVHQYIYAKDLDKAGNKAEALRWHEKTKRRTRRRRRRSQESNTNGKLSTRTSHFGSETHQKSQKMNMPNSTSQSATIGKSTLPSSTSTPKVMSTSLFSSSFHAVHHMTSSNQRRS